LFGDRHANKHTRIPNNYWPVHLVNFPVISGYKHMNNDTFTPYASTPTKPGQIEVEVRHIISHLDRLMFTSDMLIKHVNLFNKMSPSSDIPDIESFEDAETITRLQVQLLRLREKYRPALKHFQSDGLSNTVRMYQNDTNQPQKSRGRMLQNATNPDNSHD
jgi:hypothetical protein